jgi:hypothetical protein
LRQSTPIADDLRIHSGHGAKSVEKTGGIGGFMRFNPEKLPVENNMPDCT